MPKVLCLLCTRYKHETWNLGYCEKKKKFLKTLYRSCNQSNTTEHTDENPELTLKWYNDAAKFAKIRVEILKSYYHSMGIIVNADS